ncbi:MAG: hypothetical protein ACKODM_00390, partial [Cytophagales bacterium]
LSVGLLISPRKHILKIWTNESCAKETTPQYFGKLQNIVWTLLPSEAITIPLKSMRAKTIM